MYVQIAKVVFRTSLNDKVISRVAETPEEVIGLVEAGFEYATDLARNSSGRENRSEMSNTRRVFVFLPIQGTICNVPVG